MTTDQNAARRLTTAQRNALLVLDNRASDDQKVRTWARSTARRTIGDRVNYRTAWTLDALGLARLTWEGDMGYAVRITAAGCAALSEEMAHA